MLIRRTSAEQCCCSCSERGHPQCVGVRVTIMHVGVGYGALDADTYTFATRGPVYCCVFGRRLSSLVY